MKKYGVKELSKLSGISVRTLHHYDKIGLLKPLHRTEAGYRYYGEEQLLRLQQILFYKELDFPLKEINALLDDADFNLIQSLETHKHALQTRQKRISQLLTTIDHTIHTLKNGEIMSKPEMLYEGLPKEVGTTYRQQAMEKYGTDAVENGEKALVGLGKEGFEKLKTELVAISKELVALQAEAPESEKVQQAISRHYQIIRQFWGTANQADNQAEAYAGLGDLYASDERFTLTDGKPQPGYALFLQKAMKHFANTQLN